jgi:transcriptional regulator with XRE-family HTH domain
MAMKIGQLVMARREATLDPLTGKPYTQDALAKALGISRSAVKKIENENIDVDAERAIRLAALLDVSVDELVRAMGFPIEPARLSADEAELIRLYRRIPEPTRGGLIPIARAAAQQLSELRPPPEPRHRAAG